MYKLKLGITPKQLEKLLRKSADDIIERDILQMLLQISVKLSEHIETIVRKTSVYADFQNHGSLWQRLGGCDLDKKLDSIIRHWMGSVTLSESGTKDNKVYTFMAIKSDYSDVIALNEAYFESVTTRPGPRQGERHSIPWLEWLLKRGREYVVKQYVFTDKLESKASRGGGLMIPKKSAAGWRVPEQHAGTIDDNFLTRAISEFLDDAVADINKIIRRCV